VVEELEESQLQTPDSEEEEDQLRRVKGMQHPNELRHYELVRYINLKRKRKRTGGKAGVGENRGRLSAATTITRDQDQLRMPLSPRHLDASSRIPLSLASTNRQQTDRILSRLHRKCPRIYRPRQLPLHLDSTLSSYLLHEPILPLHLSLTHLSKTNTFLSFVLRRPLTTTPRIRVDDKLEVQQHSKNYFRTVYSLLHHFLTLLQRVKRLEVETTLNSSWTKK